MLTILATTINASWSKGENLGFLLLFIRKKCMYYIPGYISITENKDNSISLINKYTKKEILMDSEYNCEVLEILKAGVKNINDDVSKFLHENGFILNEEEFCREIHSYYDVNDNYLRFVLMPTEGCNFRCTYCYENHINSSMKLDYEAIAKFIESKVNERDWKRIIINWFGGEPLLKTAEIKDFSKRIQPILNGKDVVSTIVTNGYNLDEKTIETLEKANVSYYQITLDGDNHDKTRILARGAPTRQTIMHNIKLLKKHTFQSCEIRVNVTDHSTENRQFYSELSQIINGDNRFSLDIHKVFESDKFKLDNLNMLEDVYKKNVEVAKDFGLNLETNEETILQCYGAQKNCYTFRPNQAIVKCTVALDDSWNQVGKVENHTVEIFDKNGTDCFSNLKKCLRCSNIRNCKRIICSKAANNVEDCDYAEKNSFDHEFNFK